VLAVVSTTIFVGAGTLAQTDEASPADAAERLGVDREVEMGVVAGQWFWRFDVDGVPPTQGERVVLPADTIIQFKTTSADVIHSFAIKELGITKDAMPGQVNQAWFYVGEIEGETQLSFTTQNGQTQTVAADTYQVRCAELCGKGHSKMIATVYIINPTTTRDGSRHRAVTRTTRSRHRIKVSKSVTQPRQPMAVTTKEVVSNV